MNVMKRYRAHRNAARRHLAIEQAVRDSRSSAVRDELLAMLGR